jgi:hypothetical protein
MLRQQAYLTGTEHRAERSHLVNEALEMVDMEWPPGKTSEGFIPTSSTDSQAQP